MILRIRIPDQDVRNWMQVLIDGGMSWVEVECLMIWLNDTFANAYFGSMVDRRITEMQDFVKERGRPVFTTSEELAELRTAIIDVLRERFFRAFTSA